MKQNKNQMVEVQITQISPPPEMGDIVEFQEKVLKEICEAFMIPRYIPRKVNSDERRKEEQSTINRIYEKGVD